MKNEALMRANEGLPIEETDGVGLGTNNSEVAQLFGGSIDETVTNPFGRLDAGFDN